MRIGICVQFHSVEGVAQQFARMREDGIRNCQLISSDETLWTEENARELQRLMRETGIRASAFWCGWPGPAVWDFYQGYTTLGLVPIAYRRRRVATLCRGSDFARLLGLTDIITHMGFIPENPNDPEFYAFCDAVRTVAEHARDNGQYLLFETGQETPVTLLRCFETVGTGNLGINLDTANLILYGKANPVDALDVFGTYVRNLHAKDGRYPTNGHDLGAETRIGDGKVDFRALFRRLHELGYDGDVTIEREIDGEQQREDIRFARDYLTQIIREECGEDAVC